jgi:hypothetical protein
VRHRVAAVAEGVPCSGRHDDGLAGARPSPSPPAASKLELYRRLLERTRNELLEMWREHLFVAEPPKNIRVAWRCAST